jgi:hypothetical protein
LRAFAGSSIAAMLPANGNAIRRMSAVSPGIRHFALVAPREAANRYDNLSGAISAEARMDVDAMMTPASARYGYFRVAAGPDADVKRLGDAAPSSVHTGNAVPFVPASACICRCMIPGIRRHAVWSGEGRAAR